MLKFRRLDRNQPPHSRIRTIAARAVCTVCLVLSSVASAADPPIEEPQIHDRRDWIDEKTLTTDDPRRIPRRPPEEMRQNEIALKGGRVFDSISGAARPATVVIQGNKIKAVLPPDVSGWSAETRVVDVAGKTVMPGLIDMHVHMTYPNQDTPIDQRSSEGAGVLRGQRNLRYFLESGFTSVRDLNGIINAAYLLSEWSAANAIPAPRVFTAGRIITGTGGHATGRTGPAYAHEADGADAWRAAVRDTFKRGASVIKIASHFSAAEVTAAVEEAHMLGLKITCDCETIYTEMAVRAGVDMIEHPLPRTDATIALMAKKEIAAVPTLQVYQSLLDRAGGYFGATSRRFEMTSQANFDMFKKMKAAGIVMGVGSDTIGEANKFIPNVYIAELKWFVKGGYSIAEALQAATITNAKLLDMDDKLGSLQAGKLADIIVVDGRPDENLDDLSKVDLVMKDGLIVVESGMVVIAPHEPRPLETPSPPDDIR